MRRVAIIGGETHVGEIARLAGSELEIVGCVVRPERRDQAERDFGCEAFGTEEELLATTRPDIVAVANENDRKAASVRRALNAGCDVVADKPLCIRMEDQDWIEAFLATHPERRLLVLLTLRGEPEWAGLRQVVRDGAIGVPAFAHVRMAVQLKREQRPPWFLDFHRSGGMFLDLLIHGLDMVEWATGQRIMAISAVTGNLGAPEDPTLRDHAAAFCELANGGTAVVDGQRMLPDTVASDYRMTVAGTQGHVDLVAGRELWVTSPRGHAVEVTALPKARSVVADWLAAADREAALVPQVASLRANRLAMVATLAADEHTPLQV